MDWRIEKKPGMPLAAALPGTIEIAELAIRLAAATVWPAPFKHLREYMLQNHDLVQIEEGNEPLENDGGE